MMDLQRYTQQFAHYLWQWEEGGQVIAIREGNTIAYSQQMLNLLKKFGGDPIPRFTPLLLSWVALGANAKHDLLRMKTIVEDLPKHNGPKVDHETLGDSFRFLEVLAQVDRPLKEETRKIALIRMLFAQAHKLVSGVKAANIIFEWDHEGVSPTASEELPPYSVVVNDLRGLAILASRYPTTAYLEKALTEILEVPELGLDTEPETQESGEPVNLVEALQAARDTFKIGTLVPHLWAGMNIPYHLAISGGQPLGGVSDLTNKGHLERLLITEFANDDDVFLSRLANQEALYLRREVPLTQEKFQRIILIDISMKSWGTPKLLAQSIGVAIAHHPKTDIPCQAYAVGKKVTPMDLNSVAGVIDSQLQLSNALHPASGLEQFLQEQKPDHQTEIFFISSKEATEYPEMYRILNQYHDRFRYWVDVAHDGRVRLFKNKHKAKHLLQEFTLPLARLWEQPPARQAEDTAQPVQQILLNHDYPVLFPAPTNYLKVVRAETSQDLYMVTRKHGIFKMIGKGPGMALIKEADYINKSCKFAITTHDEGQLWLTIAPQQKRGFLINLDTGEEKTLPFDWFRTSPSYPEVFGYEGSFYFFSDGMRYQIDWEDTPRIKGKTGIPQELVEAYVERTKMEWPTNVSGFSRVRTVAITRHGELVLGPKYLPAVQHKSEGFQPIRTQKLKILYRKGTAALHWEIYDKNEIEAVVGVNQTDNFTFRFRDGSEVTFNPLGIISFRSSDPNLETFHIALIMNQPTAVGTETQFFGAKELRYPGHVGQVGTVDHFYASILKAFTDKIIAAYEA